MFLTKEELGSVIYNYQVELITEGNDETVQIAIEAAISEVQSYLTPNDKTEWLDGRLRYDVTAIFKAQGADRNPLILNLTKIVTKWWLVELCNADVIYEQAKERYDRAVNYLKDVAKGTINLNNLPTISVDETTAENEKEPFRFGSRTKFNHE